MKIKTELPDHTFINEEIIGALHLLFDLAPPDMLRRSVHDIFWAYLCNTEPQNLKPEFKEIATDFKCLLNFLEQAERCEKEKQTKEYRSREQSL